MSTIADPRTTQLDPSILAFLKGLEAQGGAPLYTLLPADAREVLVRIQRSAQLTTLSVESKDMIISGGPTGTISLRIVRPQGESRALPSLLYIHGGGWILGDKETHDHLVREIAVGVPATVVFVDYARSPEARYPVAIEQAYTTMEWLVKHGESIGADPSRLAVVGDSVGGNMAAALTLLTKQRGGPRLIFQVLCYPVTDAHFETPSYQAFGADGYWLTREAMKWFWESYAPASKRNLPTVTPLRASLDQLRGLPPALIITDENDVLRDEGEAYAHKLMAVGVPVIATRYLGAIHDFLMLNPIRQTPPARAAVAQIIETLRRIFA